MDKLTALSVFTEVAERGSFTEAAKHLGITRSMVSRYVSDLETWLGTRLLQRSTRQLSLTNAGKDCLAKAQELIDLSAALKEEVGDQSGVPHGKLRVTCAISFGNVVLTPMVGEFLNQYDNAEIELFLTDRSTNLVQEGIDLAISMTHNLDLGSIAYPLAECESMLAASPKYLKKHGPIDDLSKLKNHNCLRHTHFGTNEWTFKHGNNTTCINVEGNFVANDALTLSTAAVNGLGVALLPTYVSKPCIKTGELVQLCKGYTGPSVGIYGVYRSRTHIPEIMKRFLAFLKERLEGQL